MNIRLILAICLSAFVFFVSCSYQKRYVRNDYPFYKKDFQLDSASLLRTDGVYVLEKIWTSENGGKERAATERQIYKFYNTGQVNLILDIGGTIKTASDYVQAFNQPIKDNRSKKSATLFESYYKLEGNKLVIQRMVTPRRQFSYNYILLEKDRIIHVSSAISGRGKIKDKYFTDHYRAYYTFIPAAGDYLTPDW